MSGEHGSRSLSPPPQSVLFKSEPPIFFFPFPSDTVIWVSLSRHRRATTMYGDVTGISYEGATSIVEWRISTSPPSGPERSRRGRERVIMAAPPPEHVRVPTAHRRLVLVPYPTQGHVSPMLQLASLLHSQGFSITVVQVVHPGGGDPSSIRRRHRDFTFASVGPLSVPAGKHPAEGILLVNAGVEEPLRLRLGKMAEEDGEPPACVITDSIFYAAVSAADKVRLPVVALKTGSAAGMNLYRSLLTSWEEARHPFPLDDSSSNSWATEIPHYSAEEVSAVVGNKSKEVREILSSTYEALESARAVIVNTVEALEPSEVAALRRTLRRPVYPIGPLHCLCGSARSSSLWVEDRTCIEWLDQLAHHPPHSVLYVSFGSMVCVEKDELEEVAWGLADSGQPFLWVLREGSVRGGAAELPEGFAEATRGRGKVVRWAPQQDVLRHTAVGGFWTHSGWNSTLESLCEGVPMVCWPRIADQPVNARYVARVWGVGILLTPGGGALKRGEVRRAVRRLMVEDEGKEMRRRAAELKEEARRCVAAEGTSLVHLRRLVKHITSMSAPSIQVSDR